MKKEWRFIIVGKPILKYRHANQFKGELILSDRAHIHKNVEIELSGNVIIKDYAEIANYTMIFTHKHHWNHSRDLRKDIQTIEPVDLIIESDVFIGVRCILYGVERIGKGAVIGAGSMLTKNVPDFEIWAGNPAKKIGERRDE